MRRIGRAFVPGLVAVISIGFADVWDWVPTHPTATTNCRDCEPGLANVSPQGLLTIGFEFDPNPFSPTETSSFMQGASSYWNPNYNNTGISVDNTETFLDDARIRVILDDTLRGTTDNATAAPNGNGGGIIRVNPDRINDARSFDWWKWLGTHEVGHLLGLRDVHDTARDCQLM
jgi:hypothetical protein